VSTESFPPTSRYYSTETDELETTSGKTIVFLRRRFVPPPERFQLLHEHTVAEGQRPDHLSARYLGDPEQFWRLCDANVVMHPEELTDPIGRSIRITLPEGVPGGVDE
jgi:hypothetical protein